MEVNLHGFNASEVDPSVGFELIPSGNYVCVITASEMKPTRSGVGAFLQLTIQIIEGDCSGRLLWARLNLDNPNDTAVKIARAELSAICRAVNVLTPKIGPDLHDIPLIVRVGCKKRKDTGEMSNVVKGYAKRDGAGASSVNAVMNGSVPPWKR